VLQSIGKDLSHVGGWIEDGLKIVEPIVGVLYPPLGPFLTEIETVLGNLPTTAKPLTEQQVQAIITAITILLSLGKSTAPAFVITGAVGAIGHSGFTVEPEA